jgi:lysophospholipase L1-like esterase
MERTYTYLALGDSYTIGEGVVLQKSFPYQAVTGLRKKGFHFASPEVIAKTGWTTAELGTAIEEHTFLSKYDFVTLLIGVNNQYRGQTIEAYKIELESLLKKSLDFADGKKEHVIVVSIPDYSITPFGQKMDAATIKHEIDLFNSVNKALSIQYKTNYIDITEGSRAAKEDVSLLAEDGLHPSEKEYKKWAAEVIQYIVAQIK